MPNLQTISQSELLNHLEEILRQTEKGESFLITMEGRPVAQLSPSSRYQWVPRAEVMKLLRNCEPDPRFFEDISEIEVREV